MERLHQVVRCLTLLICCASGLCALSADDECSLVVRVLTPDGRRPEAPVSVEEKNGRRQTKDQENDDVRFCDLGILPVTVTVGSAGMCNQVTVHDVPVLWHETYLLTVTYDPMACVETLPPPVPVCTILFRVADSSGKWIPEATITLSGARGTTLRADRHGRAFDVATAGEEVRGLASGPGFQATPFGFKCSPSEQNREEYIRLDRR